VPTDLRNFFIYYERLCLYGIKKNILVFNDNDEIKCDESLNIYFNYLFNLAYIHNNLEVAKYLFKTKPV
jgi:hypothetical protein